MPQYTNFPEGDSQPKKCDYAEKPDNGNRHGGIEQLHEFSLPLSAK
jgi:hypothetical protein